MRLPPISRHDLIKRLRAFEWTGPFPGRKHQHMVKDKAQLTIPNPHTEIIGV